MTTEGVDYTYGPSGGGAALAAEGKTFACRYLAGTGKGLDAGEVRDLVGNGVAIVANYEASAEDMKYGYDKGVEHANAAQGYLVDVGLPPDQPIYFSADWDVATSQYEAVDEYLRACADVLGGIERVGLYGGVRIIRHCQDTGTARWFWQTYAWSGGDIADGIHLYQYKNGVQLCGVDVDLDRAYVDDYAQYPRPEGADDDVTAEDVEQIAAAVWGHLINRRDLDPMYASAMLLNTYERITAARDYAKQAAAQTR